MDGEIASKEIERKRGELDEISQYIWRNPEAGFKEVKASEKVADYLEREGFRVERGAGGVPTAIKASYGNGHPVIGFMGEFDALPGLSQKVSSKKEEIPEQTYGCLLYTSPSPRDA